MSIWPIHGQGGTNDERLVWTCYYKWCKCCQMPGLPILRKCYVTGMLWWLITELVGLLMSKIVFLRWFLVGWLLMRIVSWILDGWWIMKIVDWLLSIQVVPKKNSDGIFEVWQLKELSGHFGHFWMLWTLFDIFGHSRHFWARFGKMARKCPKLPNLKKFYLKLFLGRPVNSLVYHQWW